MFARKRAILLAIDSLITSNESLQKKKSRPGGVAAQ